MRLLILAAFVLAVPVSSHGQNRARKSTAASTNSKCVGNSNVVAKCFEVHGRLSFYNGTPSARIWKIGTKRLLGVHDGVFPGQLGARMSSFGMQAFGEFRVCPLTREEPGVMQMVCIASAKNLEFKKVE